MGHALQFNDASALSGFYGLGGSLHDALALAQACGPGALLGFGAGQAEFCDVLAPEGAVLARAEVEQSAALGRTRYFLSFGTYGLGDLAPVAGAIEHLAAATGVGFMAVCLAAPGWGRTVYQGHLFEAGKLKVDLARGFGLVLDGAVGVVAHEIVAAGESAIRAQCGRLKEQGKVLALIDAISEADCAAVAAAMAVMKLAGGGADFARPRIAGAAVAGVVGVKKLAGPVAILSGALDRQTIFQIGAARDAMAVYDLDFTLSDPVAAALAWASDKLGASAFIITSTVPPDRVTPSPPAAVMLGAVARGLAAFGVVRFVIAGGETAGAVRETLGVRRLQTCPESGPFLWLSDENVAISIKPPQAGAKTLFLYKFEPHLSLNDIAEMAT